MSSSEISSVISKLGINFSSSVVSRSFFVAGLKVDRGKTERVYFKPLFRHTSGRLEKWRYSEGQLKSRKVSTKNVQGKVPMKVGKFADGIYYTAR